MFTQLTIFNIFSDIFLWIVFCGLGICVHFTVIIVSETNTKE